MVWYPHVTVATVVSDGEKFLMVTERNERGELVYNQPAGHLEESETLVDAAIRETLEETGWHVTPTKLLGQQHYTAPANGVTYLRTNFIAEPNGFDENYVLDADIESAIWLTIDEIQKVKSQWRSELVGAAISAYQSGISYPLSLLNLK